MPLAALVLSLVALFGPRTVEHVRNSADRWTFNDDARQQIWPFLRFHEPGLFQDDYLTDYQLGFNPIGWSAIYRIPAALIDPRPLSKALPYLLLVAMLIAVGRSAYRLGGYPAAWGAVALCLAVDTYWEAMGGGLPRAFGFPLAAFAGLALIRGSPWGLALVCVLGALLYYPIAAMAGLALTLFLLVPSRWGGLPEPWSVRRRLSLLGATGGLTIALALPNALALDDYGATVTPDDWSEYPEAAPGGRLGEIDVVRRPALGSMPGVAVDIVADALDGDGQGWVTTISAVAAENRRAILLVVLGIAGFGYFRLMRVGPDARRLMLLPAAGVLAYLVSWIAVPYLYVPGRYLRFALPLVFVVGFAAAARAVGDLLAKRLARPSAAGAAGVAIVSVVILLLGGRGTARGGLYVFVPEEERPLYEHLAQLPADALVAGWPTSMDNVPYVTGRRAFVIRETHLPFHSGYLDVMRDRMWALIDAYFAGDPGPLIELRRLHGVSHLLVDRRHYLPGGVEYFPPFGDVARQRASEMESEPAALQVAESARVYDEGNWLLIDLQRIDDNER